jgi:dephospho-CoA kinase
MSYHGKTLIGLTGNIACGKSTILQQLRELGAHTVDADKLIHGILRKGEPAYWPVITEFGPGILDEHGEIDRRKLGTIVFADPERLRKLEEIEHPIVRRVIDQEIADAEQPIVVLDAIKLIESGWADRCDSVWVVTCTPEQQLERLMQTRGYSQEEAHMRIGAQSPQATKVERADIIIDNSGTLEDTRRQVSEAWDRLMQRTEDEDAEVPRDAGEPDTEHNSDDVYPH